MPEECKNQLLKYWKKSSQDKIKLIKLMYDEFGEHVLEVLNEDNKKETIKEWREIAEGRHSNDIPDLIECLWKNMGSEQGWDYSIEKKDEGVQITCTKCPLVEISEKGGSKKIGYELYCKSDYYINEGFNSEIKMKRTKTLMQGDDCCNHFYFYEKK